jgi:hypothetical protein
MGGARMVEEVGELELRDELPEGKLQEFGGVKKMRMCVSPLGWCPSCPYIAFGAKAYTKKNVLPIEGS